MSDPKPQIDISSGLYRLLARAPIWLYRLGLGGLLGKRILMLRHTGRKSGQPRQVVLEVMRHDPAENAYYVCSGFGERSDWYRNIQAQPQVTIESGGWAIPANAETLDEEDAAQEMLDYSCRHPTAFRELSRILSFDINGEDDILNMGRCLPVVRFSPR